MKTSVDIADSLLRRAKAIAAHTTLRALIEEGLRWVLKRRRNPMQFKLRDASVTGKGVRPGIDDTNWTFLRD